MNISLRKFPKIYIASFIAISAALHFTAIAPLFSIPATIAEKKNFSQKNKSHTNIQEPSIVEFEYIPEDQNKKPKKIVAKKENKKQEKKLQVLPTPQKKKASPQTKQSIVQKNNDVQKKPDNTRYLSEKDNQTEEETVAKNRSKNSTSPENILQKSKEEKLVSNPKTASKKQAKEQASREKNVRSQNVSKSEPSHLVAKAKKDGATASDLKNANAATEVLVSDGVGSFRIRALNVSAETAARSSEKLETKQTKNNPFSLLNDSQTFSSNKKVPWSSLSQSFGKEELEEERNSYELQEESKSYTGNWKKFKAAMENFVPGVKPGNQTSLNASASPFASYLAIIHQKIHAEFADQFLRNLTNDPTHPFSDQKLFTVFEIQILPSGKIEKLGVIQSSGFLPFDAGAFSALMRAQPFNKPPSSIQSADGKVYIHWGFYRNQRQCGTFNAQPYIIKDTNKLRDSFSNPDT